MANDLVYCGRYCTATFALWVLFVCLFVCLLGFVVVVVVLFFVLFLFISTVKRASRTSFQSRSMIVENCLAFSQHHFIDIVTVVRYDRLTPLYSF